MPEIENIEEESQEARKSESPEEVNEINSQEQIIEITQTETQPSQIQTENMEVHHHPKVENKNFKEYFLEFLMIFLAVTLGFFAENIREHFVNSDKEKIYMHSMLLDLKRDTAEVNKVIGMQRSLVKKMDSALSIPAEKLNDIDVQDTFYHHFIYFYGWQWTFTRYDNTISQLKNAGGFSIIQNKRVVDSISNLNITYEGNVNYITDHFYSPRWQRLDEFAMQLMILPEIPLDYTDSSYNVYLHHQEILLRYDKPQLEQLYSFIRFEKADIEILEYWEKLYADEASRLIELIQKEYHLENE
jgi:hypothetical protein